MFDRITEFFIDIETGDVQQSQREALIDLLICTMMVDGSIAFSENARFEQVLGHLNWQSPLQVRQYLGMAYSRLRTALDEGGDRSTLLTHIAQGLANKSMCGKAYDLVEELAAIDGSFSDAEQQWLEQLRLAIGGVH